MALTVCGVNHTTAPLRVRERLAVLPTQLPETLAELIKHARLSEAAILSTCNRTEIYCYTDSQDAVVDWFCQRNNADDLIAQEHLYIHSDQAALRHMIRVASGLDSMVVGESQILGQMKTAFQQALSAGTIGKRLHHVFQYIFTTTKEVRSNTEIGKNSLSIASVAVNLAKHIFTDLKKTQALVIGAGETTQSVLHYLRANQVKQIWIANRTLAKGQLLAQQFNATPILIRDIADVLPYADLVYTATTAPIAIIGKGAVETAIKLRKHKPILMVDLAIPRDIEPEVANLEDVYLYCLDDLQQIIVEHTKDRKTAAIAAEDLIEQELEHYARWQNSLATINVLKAFRDKIEYMKDMELNRAINQLQLGESAEKVVCALARSLTNKFLHQPTTMIKQAGYDGKEDLLESVKILYDLDNTEI